MPISYSMGAISPSTTLEWNPAGHYRSTSKYTHQPWRKSPMVTKTNEVHLLRQNKVKAISEFSSERNDATIILRSGQKTTHPCIHCQLETTPKHTCWTQVKLYTALAENLLIAYHIPEARPPTKATSWIPFPVHTNETTTVTLRYSSASNTTHTCSASKTSSQRHKQELTVYAGASTAISSSSFASTAPPGILRSTVIMSPSAVWIVAPVAMRMSSGRPAKRNLDG